MIHINALSEETMDQQALETALDRYYFKYVHKERDEFRHRIKGFGRQLAADAASGFDPQTVQLAVRGEEYAREAVTLWLEQLVDARRLLLQAVAIRNSTDVKDPAVINRVRKIVQYAEAHDMEMVDACLDSGIFRSRKDKKKKLVSTSGR